jgi:hypothetical protein
MKKGNCSKMPAKAEVPTPRVYGQKTLKIDPPSPSDVHCPWVAAGTILAIGMGQGSIGDLLVTPRVACHLMTMRWRIMCPFISVRNAGMRWRQHAFLLDREGPHRLTPPEHLSGWTITTEIRLLEDCFSLNQSGIARHGQWLRP